MLELKDFDTTGEKITDRTAYNMCAITIEAAMRRSHDGIKKLSAPSS